MRYRFLFIGAIAVLCATACFMLADYSDAEDTITTHPYPNYYSNNSAWVSHSTVNYQMYGPSFNPLWYYFNCDPYDQFSAYARGEIEESQLTGRVLYSDLVYNQSYWIAGFDYNYSPFFSTDNIIITPQPFYLEAGDYTINIIDTDCTYLCLRSVDGDGESISLTTGEKTTAVIELSLSIPAAYYFEGSGTDKPWRELTILYSIDPAVDVKKVTDFNKTVRILSNRQWVRYTTEETITGSVQFSDTYMGPYYLFEQGSAEENSFIENIVNKNLIDGSPYGSNTTSSHGKKVVIYQCSWIDRGYNRNNFWLSIDPNFGTAYTNVGYYVDKEEIPTGSDDGSKFYAGKEFSIAVKYDTSKFLYVVMEFVNIVGQTEYAPLESERLYKFTADSAAEYAIYGVVRDDATEIGPDEIQIYTEGVAEKDDAGLIFAAIAIFLCALAFGTLFMAGRHPRWKDDAGLPETSEEE